MVDDLWLEKMPQSTITHLSSVGSDLYPLLFEVVQRQEAVIRYFKFLNCWVDNPNFLDAVKVCWSRPIEGNPMWRFHMKLKRVSNTLSKWSKNEFGDIFATVKEFEEKVRMAEDDILNDNTGENRTKLNCVQNEYIRFLKLEQSILKQKSQLQWGSEREMLISSIFMLLPEEENKGFSFIKSVMTMAIVLMGMKILLRLFVHILRVFSQVKKNG